VHHSTEKSEEFPFDAQQSVYQQVIASEIFLKIVEYSLWGGNAFHKDVI